MKRFERILALVHVLAEARQPVSFDALKSTFEDYQGAHDATRRKFERDKATLSELGIELEYDSEQGGYLLPRGEESFLKKIQLSSVERGLLTVAVESALNDPSFPLKDALGTLSLKLGTMHGAAHPALEIQARAHRAESDTVLTPLIRAQSERSRVRFGYTRIDGTSQERCVQVHAVFIQQAHWYMRGWDEDRNAARVFRCDRIASIANVETVPKDEVQHATQDHSAWRDPYAFNIHDSETIHVEVDAAIAFLMAPKWGTYADGEFRIETTNREAVIDDVLPLGSRARIRAPERAVTAMTARLDAALKTLRNGAR